MSDSPLILGVSGLRGIVGESLTQEVAEQYAAVFGSWVNARTPLGRYAEIVLARDGRAGGEVLEGAVSRGLSSVGCRVRRLGVAMTPSVGVAVDALRYDAGMIITASHNPQQWNGVKALVRGASWDRAGESDGMWDIPPHTVDACAPSAVMADELIDRYRAATVYRLKPTDRGEVLDDDRVERAHSEAVWEAIERVELEAGRGFRVITDSVNASSSRTDAVFFEDSGMELMQLNADGSGVFPHTPEPTRENLSGAGGLCDVVREREADVGFAQDPDADRLAIVDERGEYIGEECTLVLCAMALMEARFGGPPRRAHEPVLVVNLSTSRMIDDLARRYGARVFRTAVGEANVVEAMKALKASGRDVVLGGEGNGGVIWPQVTYVRDSLSGMALVLSLMARTGKTVSELVSMINAMGPTEEVNAHGYTIIKKKSALASKDDAKPVVEHLRGVYGGKKECRVDLQDGIRIDWDTRGVWAHVRASNTEPIMRVIVEAPSGEEAEAVAGEIEGEIGAMGNDSRRGGK